MSNPTKVLARLKVQANAFFEQNQFAAAYEKYTQAIQHDSQNANLYCNRAACALRLTMYLDACATELDIAFAKARAHQIAARAGIDINEEIVKTWEGGLDLLPAQYLSPAEQTQRAQYLAEFSIATTRFVEAQAACTPNPAPAPVTTVQESDIPWSRAYVIAQDLMPKKIWNSSAWIVFCAHLDWIHGVELMDELAVLSSSGHHHQGGRRGAIERLSNGLLADPRGVDMRGQNFIQIFTYQLNFEMASTGAWATGDPKRVMEEAPKRLALRGWDSVRPALSVTVRAWIMQGFFKDHISNDFVTALDFYNTAIEVLQWGTALWRDVSTEWKGAIFQASFLRGVKCLRLDTLAKAHSRHCDPTAKFPLAEIIAGAEDLIAELSEHRTDEPTGKEDYGHHMSFIRYPLAQGYFLRGFYHQHVARNVCETQGPASVALQHLKTAAAAYIQAAEIYPKDDEKYVLCLHHALETLIEGGTSANEVLKLLNHIHEAIPVIRRIWEFSDATGGRDVPLKADMELRDRFLMHMPKGSSAETVISRGILRNTLLGLGGARDSLRPLR
ncbi:uncharacterized protein TRAVEDRAFT_68650 [Trametes versicolor FP-101664 SS1]|uniref:uncharacterized protein n=1 Tax=Trametes versicolor (strain FP-101664) TaxID=717944 RepID=UPI00046242E5|nr:uncharacterized protein TRAVEDRAFT_68650 [Trametes versicolor FP-101664 SS1]EIW64992.1 hypothetical protein TRAVEDRAFT_68650 [Trametes versicolor FP-101664 SS1]